MGMGHILIVNKSIYEEFEEKIKNVNTGYGWLYQHWKKIVIEILQNK